MKSLLSFKNVKRPTTLRTLASKVDLSGQISLLELMYLLELVTLPRPFYLICHRCNDLDAVKSAVSLGANAIECDIQFTGSTKSPIQFCVNHDNDWQAERDSLVPYLKGLTEILKKNPQVALVIFDLKDDKADRADQLRNLIRAHLTDHVPVNIIMSEADYESRDFFVPIKHDLDPREAYAIDQHDDPVAVSDFFLKEHNIVNHCFGDGVFVAGVEKNIPRAIMEGIALKWSERKIRWVYVWTLREQASMRDYIAMGVDGIMVNHEDIVHLKNIVNANKHRVRLATRRENPFRPPLPPGYVLTVKTSNRDYAGTDADVTFELRGSAGSLSTKLDLSPVGLMEAGKTNRVTLIGADLEDIQELILTHDGSGDSPDWFVDTMQVQKSGSLDVLNFNFDQWIRANRPARRTPATVAYKLTVTTKDVGDAGTDADVKIVLNGTKGSIEKEFDGAGGTGRFEKGDTNSLVMHGIDIGSLTSVTVSHDGSGAGDEWNLLQISIQGASINRTVKFDRKVVAGKPVTVKV